MESYSRIGILGGSFNPVHVGHLILAQSAVETFDLSQTLFVPCAKQPHKDAAIMVSAEHRLAMLNAAIENDLRFQVCDIDVKRGGRSYSIDTVALLREMYPRAELYFIIGSDTLSELHLWKDVDCLLKLCKFAVFERPGFESASITAEDLHMDGPWSKRLLQNVAAGHSIGISSSDIRHRIAEGMSICYLVPAAVEMYIVEHNLYSCGGGA